MELATELTESRTVPARVLLVVPQGEASDGTASSSAKASVVNMAAAVVVVLVIGLDGSRGFVALMMVCEVRRGVVAGVRRGCVRRVVK